MNNFSINLRWMLLWFGDSTEFWLIFDVFDVNFVNGGVFDIFVAVLSDFEDFDSHDEKIDIVGVVLRCSCEAWSVC